MKVSAEIFPDPNAPEKNLCRLTVSDNCIGFEEKYAERIFQVFQRLHTRNEYEGTGMGLAIVKKKIALYHGGDVIAKSKPGEGATFIMTIPAAHPKNQPDEDQKKEGQKKESLTTSSRPAGKPAGPACYFCRTSRNDASALAGWNSGQLP